MVELIDRCIQLNRCIELELRAKRIYEWLARRFRGYNAVSDFFDTLAHEEKSHAELLALCREAAKRCVWKDELFAPRRDAIPRLERQMAEVEKSLDSLESVADALRLVIQIESSELNHVFGSVIAASGAGFVRKVRAFQNATVGHICSICEEIPRLEPDLAERCREFRDCFFADTE